MITGNSNGNLDIRTFDQITADYQAAVAKRQAESARRDAAWAAFWLSVTQLCAVLNYIACGAMVIASIDSMIQAIQTHHTPTPTGVFVIGFLIVQGCAWTYILLFPRYIASLNAPA